MDIAALASQVFGVTVLVTVFTIGLRTHPQDALYLLRRWDQGLKALIALFVVVPAAVIVLCLLLDMPRPVKAAFIALSVAPMLPGLPNSLRKLGVEHPYAVSLAVVAALGSLVAAPVVFSIVSRIAAVEIDLDTASLVRSLAKGLFLPLAVGAAMHAVAPRIAMRIADPIGRVATPVLLLSVLIVVWTRRELVVAQVDAQVLLAILVFVAVGLVAGHFLGGPDRGDRAALALTAASRHAGFTLAIVKSVIPESLPSAGGVILLYFLLRGFLVMPYTNRIRRT